jgi:hypothetical protein
MATPGARANRTGAKSNAITAAPKLLLALV